MSLNEAYFHILLDSIAEAVISLDLRGFVVSMNHAAEELSGFRVIDAAGKMVPDILHFHQNKDAQSLADLIDRVIAKGGPEKIPGHIMLKSCKGETLDMTGSVAPVKTGEGEIFGTVVVLTNLSQPSDQPARTTGGSSVKAGLNEEMNIEKALIQEQYLMSALMDNVPDHIYFKDLDSRFIRNNLAHALSFGFDDPDQLKGKSDFDFFLKDVAQKQFEDEQNIIRTGQAISQEEYTIRSDNSVNWYSTTKMPLRDKDGTIVGTFGLSRDITERKQVEEELRKLSIAVEQSPVSIVITNLEGNIVYANPKACETTGYSREELIGNNPRVLKSGETKDMEYGSLWSSITSGNQWSGFFHNKKKNGELYWESSTIGPIKDSKGNITHYLAIKEDITERRKAEKKLQQMADRLSLALESGRIGIWELDVINNVLIWDDQMFQFFGIMRDELSDPLTARGTGMHPDDLRQSEEELQKTLNGEKDFDYYYRTVMPNGDIRYLHSIALVKRDSSGKPERVIGTDYEITDMKQAEEQIKQKNEDLIKLNAEKDKFFSIIAHDLRGPFGTFLNLTKIMAEELHVMDQSEIEKIVTAMSKSTMTLFEMLENLLEWARIHRGLTNFEPSVMVLKLKILKFIQALHDSADSKQVTIHVDIPADLEIFADEMMLGSTIRNLVSNAIKFTKKGGEVTISARLAGDQSVLVSVKDTGIGMNQKILDKLFRIDENASRKGTEGESSSGLGLLLCKEFIEKHGGKIWVESEENLGSTFLFLLPGHTNASPARM